MGCSINVEVKYKERIEEKLKNLERIQEYFNSFEYIELIDEK